MDPDTLVNLDFHDADIKSVIKFLSEQTRTNYFYDESIRGKITVVGPRRVSLKEAVWLLESLLEFKGYTVVRVGDFKKVIPIQKAQGDVIETRTSYGKRKSPDLAEDKLVTQLIHLKHTSVNDIKQAISGLLGSANALITYPATNTIILTENALNIERLMKIVAELDTPVQGKGIHIIPVRHMLAKELADQLEKLLKQKANEKIEPETKQVVVARPVVIPDERTNSLIIVCLDKDLASLKELVARLDKDVRFSPEMKVVQLKYADAEDLVTTLEKMIKVGGEGASKAIAAVADKRTNSIILSSISRVLLDRTLGMIRQLDLPVEVEMEEDVVVRVYHLEFAEAERVAELLSGFEYIPLEEKKQARKKKQADRTESSSAEAKIKVLPDKATNSLIITCPKYRWPYVRDVIEKLDVVRPQVMVEVLIVEIDVTRARQLGLDFNALDDRSTKGAARPFALGNADGLEAFLGATGVANGLSVGILTGKDFDVEAASNGDMNELSKIAVLIRALKNDTRANILSAPQLTTSDNEPAKISVGEQIQLPTSFNTAANTGLNTITNYSTEDLGIILEITPRITKNDFVVMKINQVIKTRTADTLYDQNIPVISKRDLETNITVKDNTTIVIGGLLSESENESETHIPVLSKLPVLGKLFRNKRTELRKTNLMIFLTPHILRNEQDASKVTNSCRTRLQKTIKTSSANEHSEMRRRFPAIEDTEEKMNRRKTRNVSSSAVAGTAQLSLATPKPGTMKLSPVKRALMEKYPESAKNSENIRSRIRSIFRSLKNGGMTSDKAALDGNTTVKPAESLVVSGKDRPAGISAEGTGAS